MSKVPLAIQNMSPSDFQYWYKRMNELGSDLHFNPPVGIPPFPAVKMPKNHFGQDENYRMLAMRMRWRESELPPLQHVSLYVTQSQAFVFVVSKDQAVILEDDAELFPSDKLITQLRLLIG